jgi:release factor glutamine methyltransferase
MGDLLQEGTLALASARGSAREDPRRESAILLRAATGVSSAELLLRRAERAAPTHAARFREWIDARGQGVPLQHLIGSVEFHAITIRVEPGVFIPRPETELLVEEAILDAPHAPCILDLCTGTGAVALAIAHALAAQRKAPRVYAGDIDPKTVNLARRNAQDCGVDAFVNVRESDLGDAFADLAGCVDVLAANPPYINPELADSLPWEVRFGDPPSALFDPDGGTGFHRRIALQGRELLKPGGKTLLEIGEDQGEEVAAILRDSDY